ncbi:MAG TPA: DUF2059 domain-containing protein [Blastocatellia bacterium]|nr:DUF2059 domain-containing protein [Blastocatellia bacterium]
MRYAVKAAGLSLLLVVSICQAANAQDEITPEKRALIKELYLATRADKLAESFTNAILTQMERDLPKLLSESPEMMGVRSDRQEAQTIVSETSARVFRRFKELMPQRINFTEVMEQMFYPIYDKFFTEAELKDLVAFYKSPTGQKSIGVMPQLMQDATRRSSMALNERVMDLVTEVLQEEKRNAERAGARR